MEAKQRTHVNVRQGSVMRKRNEKIRKEAIHSKFITQKHQKFSTSSEGGLKLCFVSEQTHRSRRHIWHIHKFLL